MIVTYSGAIDERRIERHKHTTTEEHSMNTRETFALIEAHITRTGNPAAEFVIVSARENADDSKGETVLVAPDWHEEQVDPGNGGNAAYWDVALSTLAAWMDDLSMWDGYRRKQTGSLADFSEQQIAGLRRSYATACRAIRKLQREN